MGACCRSKLAEDPSSSPDTKSTSSSPLTHKSEKTLPLLPTINWQLALQRGLGKHCEICADGTRLATHSGPCCHSACSSCWNSWTKESNRCMFCNVKILERDVTRAPFEVVPCTGWELDSHNPADLMEDGVHAAVNQLVYLKDLLLQVTPELRAVLEHADDPEEDAETRAAIAQVDAASVTSILNELTSNLEWSGCCELLRQAAYGLSEHGRAVTTFSDEATSRCQTLCCVYDNAKDSCKENACTAWRGQLRALQLLRVSVIDQLLPAAVEAVCSRGGFNNCDTILAVTEMSLLQSEANGSEHELSEAADSLDEAAQTLLAQLVEVPANYLEVEFGTPRSEASEILSEDCLYIEVPMSPPAIDEGAGLMMMHVG